MRVILNADDLGISAAVNEATFALMARGRLTSATMLVNSPAFEQAAAQVHRFPRCSFGIHLNVTEFESLSQDPGFGPHLGDDGHFQGHLSFRRSKMNAAFREAVLQEWRAQVRRALDAGVPVSHFDSHHHVHTIPVLFGALKQLQLEFGIRKVRASRNLYSSGDLLLPVRIGAKAAWNLGLRTVWATRTTEGFTDLADFMLLLEKKPPKLRTLELMLHPGHPDNAEETALLDTPWMTRAPYPIELISYHDL